MAVIRIVETDVYCDVCGDYIIGWRSEGIGVSREWAKHYARAKGCTTGKRIVCKKCRIRQRIDKCSIQKRMGSAGTDGDGSCMGFANEGSDEPIEKCKNCIACTSHEWNEDD